MTTLSDLRRIAEAARCKHVFRDYHDGGACETDYCEWSEGFCIKCRRYVLSCLCGYMTALDGWPLRRRLRFERAKTAKLLAARPEPAPRPEPEETT